MTALWTTRPSSSSPNDPSDAQHPSTLRILLVEDNPVNQKVVLSMLHRLGYPADVAGNGIEALAALHRTPYDVVLMAVQMPEMDGIEATRRVRSDFSADHQPTIIAMTANANPADRTPCTLAGMNEFLAKPVRFEQLAASLAEISLGRPVTAPVPAPAGEPGDGPLDQGSPHLRLAEAVPVSRSVIQATAAPVYDPAALDSLIAELGEEGDGVRDELIGAYLDDCDNRLEALTAARDDASGEVLRSTAHALKSASATLGLSALSAAAADIETALRTAPQDVDVALQATLLITEFRRATVTLRAILHPEPADYPAITAHVVHPAVAEPAVGVPTILLVEDDAVSRAACVAMLTKMGYRVEVAANGSDALHELEHTHYAAVLMDCGMPVLDGYETTRELRRREGSDRHTPVIALTAANMAPDRVRCSASGMDEYLTKPINVLQLTKALQYWARGIGTRSTSRSAVTGSWWVPGQSAPQPTSTAISD